MMQAHLQNADWTVLSLYVIFLLIVGFWKRKQTDEEYLIANRSLGLPAFVATLVATWYGGILGAGEFVYTDGIAAWMAQGLPYYVFALIFAVFLAARIRGSAVSVYTIPDKFEQAYDRKTALLGALFAFIYASPSTYVLMLGTMLQILFGWGLLPSMVIGLIFSVIYVFRGGFLSDVRVNALQFLLMFAGFAAAAILCVHKFGGWTFLNSAGRLPSTHLHLMGTHDKAWAIVWFFIALTTLTDPGFHQRCYAAKTPRIAAMGIGLAVLCWMLFDFLTTTTGLYARALIPDLADPKLAFPALVEKIFPPGWKGLFYLGIIAPIMASAISYTFIAAMTVGRDFIWRLRNETDNTNVPAYTRAGLAAASILSILIALALPSVVEQWYIFGNIFVPGMLMPVLGAYSPKPAFRAKPNFAFASMIFGAGAAVISLIVGWTHGGLDSPRYLFDIPPMYPGLICSGIVYTLGLISKQNESNL